MLRRLLDTMTREWRLLTGRPLYLVSFILVPLVMTLVLTYEMNIGLPANIPVAVVDLDNSSLSRRLTRELVNQQMLEVIATYHDQRQADEAIQQGEIFGYFYIPDHFSEDVLAMRRPELAYFSNYMYMVPASLSYRSFKTQAMLTSASVMLTAARNAGIDPKLLGGKLQPYSTHMHMLGNPQTHYGIYLNNSFCVATLALMVLLMTIYTITHEMKMNTAGEWLDTAGDSMLVALLGKLLPQCAIFTIVGWAIQSIMYGYCGYPLNCPLWRMLLAMFLLVAATQSLAVLFVGIVPNMRIALSVGSLVGVLTFSVAGFSMPVESMYRVIGVFSYLLPMRYYFLIYIDQALNGLSLFYSRLFYVALIGFMFLPFFVLRRLRHACRSFTYIP